MVLFGILAVMAYRENTNVKNNLSQLNANAAAQAAAGQKKQDELANYKANQEPFRTYSASAVNGGFQLQIPKNWSLYAGNNTSSINQLDLIADPDVIVVNSGTAALNTHAFHLQLQRQNGATVNRLYQEKLKKKVLTSTGVTISGIPGTRYEGMIDDQRHNGVIIVLPVRDKTMVITTDVRDHLEAFDKILSTAKIVP